MNREEMEQIALKEKETRLSISRVPKEVKIKFIEIADNLFCGDYGMLLRDLLQNYIEHQQFKILFMQNIDFKLNQILENISHEQEEKSPENVIKTMSGRIVKGGKD